MRVFLLFAIFAAFCLLSVSAASPRFQQILSANSNSAPADLSKFVGKFAYNRNMLKTKLVAPNQLNIAFSGLSNGPFAPNFGDFEGVVSFNNGVGTFQVTPQCVATFTLTGSTIVAKQSNSDCDFGVGVYLDGTYAPATGCLAAGGMCLDVNLPFNACAVPFKSGMCPGPKNIKCCLGDIGDSATPFNPARLGGTWVSSRDTLTFSPAGGNRVNVSWMGIQGRAPNTGDYSGTIVFNKAGQAALQVNKGCTVKFTTTDTTVTTKLIGKLDACGFGLNVTPEGTYTKRK